MEGYNDFRELEGWECGIKVLIIGMEVGGEF